MTGLELTLAALRTHLAAVAWPRYEVRLIDSAQRACCATRYWTAGQLLAPTTARFLRARNRAGCEVYFRPHAGADSAGYLLLDFDAGPCPLADLRAAHHTPCIVVETSPGRQQAWLRVSTQTVSPSWATAVARGLAARYGADPASAEWRHLGRLAGFTNRKSARLQNNRLPPWVRVIWHCADALATIDSCVACRPPVQPSAGQSRMPQASALYQQCLHALRLRQRFPEPDWSIADYRVARFLLQQHLAAAQVAEVLKHGSPGFPRSHPNPDDYLGRTVRAAAANLHRDPAFPARSLPRGEG